MRHRIKFSVTFFSSPPPFSKRAFAAARGISSPSALPCDKNEFFKGIIKVIIPYIGPLTNIIPLQIFSDMVFSFSDDICYLRDGWTVEESFSKPQEMKWLERYCICFDFVS